MFGLNFSMVICLLVDMGHVISSLLLVDEHNITSLLWLYSPCGAWPLFQFPNLYTVARTPRRSDQPVARPLPTHKTAQTQNKRIKTSMP
jgi:hypothetical protein